MCCSSVRHFPERSWSVVAFPCFTVVKSFTSWKALLLLFFLTFSSISLHYSRAGCKKTLSLIHYPCEIKFIHLFLSSFLLPFSRTFWCCCSLPCISQILQVWIFSFSVLSFCYTDQEFLQWPRIFPSDDVCQGSRCLFQSLLCWRWLSLNLCLHLHCSWWWEVQTSSLSLLGSFPTHLDLATFWGQT